jgi:hypothetical protein
MNRYLNANPAHTEFLDMARLDSGFGAFFFGMNVQDVDPVPGTAATRAKYAIAEGISRLERLSKSTALTQDAKHEDAKALFQNIKKEVARSIESIRGYGNREAEAAQARAFAVLAPDPAKGTVYSEVRAYCREQAAKGDPDFPAKLSQMVRENIDVARAIHAGPGFLSGVGDARRMTLVSDALEAFAPDDMARLTHSVAIAGEADRMEGGLRKLEQAFFTAALADRAAGGHIDVNAPLVAPGEGQ